MKIIFFLIFIVLFISSESKAQPFETKSSYFSLNLGGYKNNLGHKMNNRYALSLTIGAGFGYALSVNSFLYSKITHFNMPKFKAYQENPEYPEQHNAENLKQIKAAFSQYIFDLGLQHNFKISQNFLFGIIGGFSYTLFNQETHDLDETIIQKVHNKGLFGYFGGLDFEKKFREDAVTVFGEIQYNYSSTKTEYEKVFNGINYTVGLRFYISRSEN